MDVLLVNPPWTFYPGTNGRLGGPPYTIAAVAAALRASGVDVGVLDCTASDQRTEEDGYTHCGLSESEIISAIRLADPFVVAVSCTWTVQFANVRLVANAARYALGNPILVAGGHDATVRPEAYLGAGFHQVVAGEIESDARAVWEAAVNDRRRGILRNRPVVELDALPLPAWDLLPMAYYKRAARPHHGSRLKGGVPLVTSRGCPHRCNFCTVHLSMGRTWRGNSPDYVMWHLEHLERMGFRSFHFEDDNLTYDRGRWMDVMGRMVGRGWRWDTPNGVRLDACSDAFIELAAESGCVELRVAPESASQSVVTAVGKGLKIASLPDVARKCAEVGLRLCAFWVIGIPGERLEDIVSTLEYAEQMESEHGVVPRVSIATPFPGTELLKECERKGWLDRPMTDGDLAGATHGKGLITTPEFSAQQVADTFADWNKKRGYAA